MTTILDSLQFYFIVPLEAENYVINPTPYRSTAGYTAFTGSIAQSVISGRRGPLCIKVTPTIANSGIECDGPFSVVDTQDYALSVDVKGEAGKAMRIVVVDAGATYTYTTQFTATGEWQRVELEFTAEETADDYTLIVQRDATTGTTAFYVDGFQFEDDEVTTFFSGDTEGFGVVNPEFWWVGEPHNSTSMRSGDTRAGGSFVNLRDYALLEASYGLSVGEFKQLYSEVASGGAFYQSFINKPRNFNFKLTYYGTHPDDLHRNRRAVLDAIHPGLTSHPQPMIIRYQGLEEDGDPATKPVDIVCVFVSSHRDLPNNRFWQKDILSFIALNSPFTAAFSEGLELGFSNTLTLGDKIVYQNSDGKWDDIDNAGTGVSGNVHAAIEDINGDVIFGGSFTDAGGVVNADGLARWTTAGAIEELGAGAVDFTDVHALAHDADGNLLIGGTFLNAGDANGDGIVKWNGSSLSSFGTGLADGSVLSIAIDPATGDIYIAGTFSGVGGVANTAYVAYWDISASLWKSVGTVWNTTQMCLNFAPNGDLYIAGGYKELTQIVETWVYVYDGTTLTQILKVDPGELPSGAGFDKQGRYWLVGDFDELGYGGAGTGFNYIMYYESGQWYAVGDGLEDEGDSLCINDPHLYITGMFYMFFNVDGPEVVKYINGAYRPVGIMMSNGTGWAKVLITSKNEIFVFGSFFTTTICSDVTQVTNNGDTKAYPIIEIKGPGRLTSIENHTTGKGIFFDGLWLLDGEIITINTDPTKVSAQERVVSSWAGRGSMSRYIIQGSDTAEFFLQQGINNIGAFISWGTDSNTKAFIFWKPKCSYLEGALYE